MLLFSEPCFLSGDSDGGDSYCEESTEEAQISVLFSLLVFMSGCCLACINYRRIVPYGCFGTPACNSIFIAISLFTTLTEEYVLTPGNSSQMIIDARSICPGPRNIHLNA